MSENKCKQKSRYFLAAFLGDLFTYCVTSIQLAFAYPSEAEASERRLLSFSEYLRLHRFRLP